MIKLRGFGLALNLDSCPSVKMTRRVSLVDYVLVRMAYARELTDIRPLQIVKGGKTYYFAQTVRVIDCKLKDVYYVANGMYSSFNDEVRHIIRIF